MVFHLFFFQLFKYKFSVFVLFSFMAMSCRQLGFTWSTARNYMNSMLGSDCVHPFVTLQNCIKANPNAFSKGILEEGKVKEEEEPTHEYIRLPLWSRGSKSSKSNL
ncbi:hypothetical protein I3760_16G000600 [Carya illinoinensis]|nr:hypothetical protein I3760_16G000600 [Carya illinoinensis]